MSLIPQLSAETYRSVLESLPTGVYLVDRQRRITFWNDGCERITGYLRHEVIGRLCADDLLMHCDDKQTSMCGECCPLLETMKDGRPREADLFLLHKDGQRIPVRVRAVPVRNDEGSIVGACECFDERVVLQNVHAQPCDPARLPDFPTMLRSLEACMLAYESSHIPFGILCMEIDGLEALSATHGNQSVSAVLRATGLTLATAIGPGNIVGRWADHRFIGVVTGCTPLSLLETAEMLTRLAGLESVPWWGDRLSISLSTGGSLAGPDDTPEELIRRAEESLAACLKKGGNCAAVC